MKIKNASYLSLISKFFAVLLSSLLAIVFPSISMPMPGEENGKLDKKIETELTEFILAYTKDSGAVIGQEPKVKLLRYVKSQQLLNLGLPDHNSKEDSNLVLAVLKGNFDASKLFIGAHPDTECRYLGYVFDAEKRQPNYRICSPKGNVFRKALKDKDTDIPEVDVVDSNVLDALRKQPLIDPTENIPY